MSLQQGYSIRIINDLNKFDNDYPDKSVMMIHENNYYMLFDIICNYAITQDWL